MFIGLFKIDMPLELVAVEWKSYSAWVYLKGI